MPPTRHDEPRTSTALAARALLDATSAPALVNHCLRTFHFGLLLAAADGQVVDPEPAYLASVLHDLGLTERFDGPDAFEEQGAAAAHAFLVARGLPARTVALVTEAIRTHLAPGTGDDPRPDIALVSRGAGLDLLGLRLERLDPADVTAVLRAYPRLDLTTVLATLLTDQATRKPDSTIGRYVAGGFLGMIESAPLATGSSTTQR